MLTKTDIAAIRAANDLCIHLNRRHPNGLVRLIKRKSYNAKPFETDQEYTIEGATVAMATLRGKESIEQGNVECFAMVGLYHDQHSHASCILKTLRADDEIMFSFYPDAHTNGYVAMGGLHADTLYLRVRRDGKTIADWELQTSICPSNSARMCRGVPDSESYKKDAEEARKVA